MVLAAAAASPSASSSPSPSSGFPTHIVGSASMFPFITAAVEQFSYEFPERAPVVEATGTGGGIKIFCSGTGHSYPEMVAASRPMNEQEKAFCHKMGVTHILQLHLGYDGLILARPKGAQVFPLTLDLLHQALRETTAARGKLFRRWSDLHPDLPPDAIRFLGPPSTSGTRQAFEELVLHPFGSRLRADGVFIDTSDQEVFTAQKLDLNPQAIGIFSYSFYQKNQARLQAFPVNHISPTFQAIETHAYPLVRALYVYVKTYPTSPLTPLLFTEYLMRPSTTGPTGFLKDYGLIPLSPEKHRQEEQKALNFRNTHGKSGASSTAAS